MLRVGGEVRHAGIEHAAVGLQPLSEGVGLGVALRLRRFEHPAQSLLDEVLELAPAQGRRGFRLAEELVRDFDGGRFMARVMPSRKNASAFSLPPWR